jgi:lipid-binding SYLF domain-containing protein
MIKKTLLGITLIFAFVITTPAQDKEQDRVPNAGKVMQEILDAPDNIPKSVLDKADCVVILPSVLKFSFGLGSSFGRGVMTCRGGKTFHGSWSAPTMMALEGAIAGLQFGGNSTDFVLLLMSQHSAFSILSSKVKIGGNATAAAGPVGRTSSAETDVKLNAEILSYSRARGLFAGISLAGSTLRPDNGANKNLYGKEVSAKAIVFHQAVLVPDCAKGLIATLEKASPVNGTKN